MTCVFADHTNMPSVSYLELAVRYTHCLWAMLHQLRVKVPATHRPSGISLPLSTGSQGTGESEKESSHDVSFVCFDRDSALTQANDRLDLSTCNSSWAQGHDSVPLSLLLARWFLSLSNNRLLFHHITIVKR